MQKNILILSTVCLLAACQNNNTTGASIDRASVVSRNNPVVTEFEELSSLSVGNGEFAFTVDATGLQTFPELYMAGVPLGTQTQWGWHSFPNDEKLRFEETLKNYNFRGWDEPYATQFNEESRSKKAADYYRINPHRLHLGIIGFDKAGLAYEDIKDVRSELDLMSGTINSFYSIDGKPVEVKTASHSSLDMICVSAKSQLFTTGDMRIAITLPYPTGVHSDAACDFNSDQKHSSKIISNGSNAAVIEHKLDTTLYYIRLNWDGNAVLAMEKAHKFVLTPSGESISLNCHFIDKNDVTEDIAHTSESVFDDSKNYWNSFWGRGGAIDFSECTDSRASELERRVVLSQYLMAIQCAGSMPPQETGLTYNSWFGKFHLEMHWWHATHFALWDRTDLLERSMDWYAKAYPVAKEIAKRQGFKGARWMKMTDPDAGEAPSKVGSFLIWQQPHFIYFAELIYRADPTEEVLSKYGHLVEETAAFMASFATYDELEGRYVLKGCIPAQETLKASEVINPPFELSYWHYAMDVAQKWRERAGQKRRPQWDELIDKLSPLAYQDALYLAAESATDTYVDIRFTSDHMAVLGSLGILPKCKLVRDDYMKNTLSWVMKNWNWGKTWGWDYPMTAMCAARLGEPQTAIDALLMDKRTNTYLVNGHNYQDGRLRVYLPGNGGLLTTVAMMCAGWDGCETVTPGFPKDGTWNVKWEGLKPMP